MEIYMRHYAENRWLAVSTPDGFMPAEGSVVPDIDPYRDGWGEEGENVIYYTIDPDGQEQILAVYRFWRHEGFIEIEKGWQYV